MTADTNFYNTREISDKEILKIMQQMYDSNPDEFRLVQLGANDGYICDRMYEFVKKNDPISVMVEPIPCYYEALKKNYSSLTNISFEQIAIDTEPGTREMVFIHDNKFQNEEIKFRMTDTKHLEYLPHLLKEHWARGLGSFYNDKNNIACPELKQHSEKLVVKTETFNNLMDKYGITKQHNIVIQTDCEGHDLEILKSFDFNKYRPKVYISEISGLEVYPPSHPKYKPLSPIYNRTKIQLPNGRFAMANTRTEILEYTQEGGMYSLEDEKEALNVFRQNKYLTFWRKDMVAIDLEYVRYRKNNATNS